ncbi:MULTISPECIES: PhzF family phenazine biosynthesis protein [unclassified Micromonospora]|uniref:PhzF family phenazine biosynthesis protein n=1 Tax=unclassified Micromonospora TaxID=2617518 RepID=UPI001C2480CB|nr:MULTISPECIES: PhzF family phenazine biosynthesis protein [unclassified Micromonospora]MBU8858706.1 PhzF family phenazine biosynthesis protein [Micromonospora sp. WMMB482]MDM4778179.1 PhzF family phenazine biosynthesis protein [Micromonospora sp. b486]MDM4778206.1 PhzF family phenazine biosynthesis protein [Micromonospora sp. b486]MDM4784350.1 PhzF family phenazine biosynthesis protein [Micromonospora sp. b486]
MSTLGYEIVDVFTDRPFAGNPLAVVFGAEGLATEQMQALALEFNLSETVFVLPPTQVGATYRARIFTPADELPFAGHPSVGAAVTASRRGVFDAGRVTQECGAGVLPIEVTATGATLTGGTPTLGPELDPEPLLEMVGLTGPDYVGPPPRVAGCGLEFPYLPVRPDAVARARLNTTAAQRYGVEHVSLFSWEPGSQTAHARVFVPGLGVPEDPATGSAALGLGVWLVASGLLPGDGRSTYTVRQGIEINRPSTLDCTVTASGGLAVGATVSGQVMPVARGEITVPPFIG